MNKKLRVGIIGTGGIARDAHIPNYLKHKDIVEVTTVCDVVKDNAEKTAEQFGIKHVFTDYQEMFQSIELDAVSICTPNKFHAEATIAALNAGCHVLCEKPPAMSVKEAKEMASVAERNHKLLMFGFCYRFTEEVKTLKRFIDGGELGEIYASRVHALRRRGIPGWGVFTNKEMQGGGPLIDIGVHMLDTALYLMGYPEPKTVLGVTYQHLGKKKGVGMLGNWDYKNFSIEDMARGMITFKNGASLLLESAFAANVEKHEEMSVSLMGVEGGADVFPLKIYQEKHDTLVDISPSYLPPKNRYESQIEQFVMACVNGDISAASAEEGIKLQQIVNGLYESAEKGEAITFK